MHILPSQSDQFSLGRTEVRTRIIDQFPDEWWDAVRATVERETGMDLAGSRLSRLQEAVVKVCRSGLPTLGDLQIRPEQCAGFIERVAAELSIGESFFLRNENHMRVLRETVIPQLLKENRIRKSFRAWSAGCAGGEEPYSLAILMDELTGADPSWDVSILGTDLNPEFLGRGREASYRQWSFRQTNIQDDPRYFTLENGVYKVQERIRRQVRFSHLNLVKDAYPSSRNGTLGLDLILFRNVAIYLKADVTAAILQRFYQALRPGGWLLLGETEVALAKSYDFEVHHLSHSTLFRKPGNAPFHSFSVPSVSVPAVKPWSSSPPLSEQGAVNIVEPPVWGPLPASTRPEASPASVSGKSAVETLSTLQLLRQRIQASTCTPSRAAIRLQLVRQLLEESQVSAAMEELEISLRETSLSLEAHLLQAGLAEDRGMLRQAEASYRRALYLDRNCAIAHFHLGLVQKQMGDVAGSKRSLRITRELISSRSSDELVEYGDGVCCGRLMELVLMLSEEEVHE